MPAVKTMASTPSSVAASPPSSRRDAGDEIGDGVARRRAVGGFQFAHVLGEAGHALEAGFFYKRSEI